MDLKEIMAINLRRIRRDRKMSQEDLAHLSGISARYVGAIERANKSASVTVLGKLATALDIDPAELLKPGERSGR